VLGFFLGKSVGHKQASNKKKTTEKEKGDQDNDQTFLEIRHSHGGYYKA
jgi:hypothetical protein